MVEPIGRASASAKITLISKTLQTGNVGKMAIRYLGACRIWLRVLRGDGALDVQEDVPSPTRGLVTNVATSEEDSLPGHLFCTSSYSSFVRIDNEG